MVVRGEVPFFFFFNDTATTEIYTLSLHDALPISWVKRASARDRPSSNASYSEWRMRARSMPTPLVEVDRKSTRLNSSHGYNSYAGFCLQKKKKQLACALCAGGLEVALAHDLFDFL